jgi:DNA (cytosine-5)-methyltransferase 1
MISEKQSEILNFIKEFTEQEGTSPTLHQISHHFGLTSVSTAHSHLSKLIDEGHIAKSVSGSIELLENKTIVNGLVPILGNITAGMPIEAIEESEADTIQVKYLPKNGDFYALKVVGDSMIDEGIYDGDVVIIKKQADAYDGQSVVAIIDENQATLKKLYKEKKGYRLQPANQTMMPIFRDDVEVRGVVWEVHHPENKKLKNKMSMRTIDLFAGIGGIRKGFEKAGFQTVFANDFEKNCKITYDLNFEDSKMVVEDITKISANDLPEFDFLLGGFPCQAFSIAGYRHGFEDLKGRGNLFFDIARILNERKPAGFLLENVKNLKTHDNGNTFKVISETLNELGYTIKSKVLNSMEYGNVPQNRERIYIVGFKDPKKTEKFVFPDKIQLTKSMFDILEKEVPEKYYYNSKPLYDRIKDHIKTEGEVYQWRRQYVRQNKKGVCPTLTANMGMGGHNVPIILDSKGIRKLTPRECFRLQGFPNSYKLPENLADSALYKQAGNSVTVSVIERVAKEMAKVL